MKKQLIRLATSVGLALGLVVAGALPAHAAYHNVGASGATVTVNREILQTGTTGGGVVAVDATAGTLTAVANRNFVFLRWEPSGSTSPVLNVNAETGAITVTAVFSQAGALAVGGITVAPGVGGTAVVNPGDYITSVMATPDNACFVFSHWQFNQTVSFVHGTNASSVTASVVTPASGVTVAATPVFTQLTTGACGPGATVVITGPDTFAPDVIMPGAPGTGTPGTPGTGTPGTGTPGTATPGTGTPGTAAPGTVTPGTGTPGTGTPGTGTPGTGTPGTGTPGTGTPGTGTPGTGTPGTGAPDLPITGQPGTGTPGTPGTGTPGTGTPGTGTPGTGTPGTGTPGTGPGAPLLITGDEGAPNLPITGDEDSETLADNQGSIGGIFGSGSPLWWIVAALAALTLLGGLFITNRNQQQKSLRHRA